MPLFFGCAGNSINGLVLQNPCLLHFSIYKSFICLLPCICLLLSDLHTCSVSLPSAWHAENNHIPSPATAANITLSFEFPYQSAFATCPALTAPSRLSSYTRSVSKLIFQKSSHPWLHSHFAHSFQLWLHDISPAAPLCSAPTQLQFLILRLHVCSRSELILIRIGAVTTPDRTISLEYKAN